MDLIEHQSGILTRKRVKKKPWKHQKSWWFLSLIARSTYSKFHNEIEQIVIFKGFLRLNFLGKKTCSRKFFFVNIKDLKLKRKYYLQWSEPKNKNNRHTNLQPLCVTSAYVIKVFYANQFQLRKAALKQAPQCM